jgi:hypothetical protein
MFYRSDERFYNNNKTVMGILNRSEGICIFIFRANRNFPCLLVLFVKAYLTSKTEPCSQLKHHPHPRRPPGLQQLSQHNSIELMNGRD